MLSVDGVMVIFMTLVGIVLFAAYILMGSFFGWVWLLGLGVLVSIYALIDPEFSIAHGMGIGWGRRVS